MVWLVWIGHSLCRFHIYIPSKLLRNRLSSHTCVWQQQFLWNTVVRALFQRIPDIARSLSAQCLYLSKISLYYMKGRFKNICISKTRHEDFRPYFGLLLRQDQGIPPGFWNVLDWRALDWIAFFILFCWKKNIHKKFRIKKKMVFWDFLGCYY